MLNRLATEPLRRPIRYIGHLSAVLGLSEESLQRRRPLRADAASSPGCPLCPDGDPAQVQVQVRGPDLGSDTRAGARWEFPAARTTPELRNPPALYAETTCPQGPVMEPSPSSPLFPSDVLALLETWIPLSPPEWPPV
ncbi:Mesoderm posterior protein 1 [Tupaia chinensis]|uniref:Mesoderm posterior protein 1 n=1 Tax=Tupaia chinensis TaxID=246437 RepID=L9KNR5_TUPCH|nr:Mesoderm posterior protein 1 [Tupaia chinensis]